MRGRCVRQAAVGSIGAVLVGILTDPCRAEESPTLLNATPKEVLGVPEAWKPVASQASEAWINVHGGRRREVAYTGLLTFGGALDLDAANWVPGAEVGITGLGIQGGNISPDAVGDAGIVSNIAGVSTVRLFRWWYEQAWLDGDLALKFGQIPLDDDFMFLDSAQLFINSGFGTPQTEALNTPAPIYPLGALGLRLAASPTERWQIKVGVYDGNAGDPRKRSHISELAIDGEHSVIVLGELSFIDEPAGRHLRATVGGFAHAGTFTDYASGADARGLGSAYVMLEHVLGRWGGSELTAFSHAALAFPRPRARVGSYADAGLVLSGGLWGRSADRMGLGVAWTEFAPRYVSATDDVSPTEAAVELTYRFVPLPWGQIQTSAQWVFDPHFSRDDAVVLGTRFTVGL